MNLAFLQGALAITPHYANTMLTFPGMNEQMSGWPPLILSLLPCILMAILHSINIFPILWCPFTPYSRNEAETGLSEIRPTGM